MKFSSISILILLCAMHQLSAKDNSYQKAKKLYEMSMKTHDDNLKKKYRKEIIKISPDSEYGFFSMAWLEDIEENNTDAELHYMKAIELNPKFGQAYINLGGLKKKINRSQDEIRGDYLKAIEIDPENSDFQATMCHFYNDEPDPVAGMTYCNKAVALDEKSSFAFLARSSLKFACNDFTGALKDINVYIKMNPNDSYGYQLRGIIHLNKRNKRVGCEDLSKAGDLGSTDVYPIMKEHCK